jgi:hypothetical protein
MPGGISSIRIAVRVGLVRHAEMEATWQNVDSCGYVSGYGRPSPAVVAAGIDLQLQPTEDRVGLLCKQGSRLRDTGAGFDVPQPRGNSGCSLTVTSIDGGTSRP